MSNWPSREKVRGWFDYKSPPKLLMDSHREDFSRIAIHETSHSTLARSSTAGVLLMIAKYYQHGFDVFDVSHPISEWLKSVDIDDVCTNLWSRTSLVQEGLACYREFAFGSLEVPSDSLGFREYLRNRSKEYADAFDVAVGIEAILPNSLFEYENEARTIRGFALLDISRFALNIPLRGALTSPKDKYMASKLEETLIANEPTSRWIDVLKTLECNLEVRSSFHHKVLPMLKKWSSNWNRGYEEGKFKGITYNDSIEPILCELFPQFPYASSFSEFPELYLSPDAHENKLEYLSRIIPEEMIPAKPTVSIEMHLEKGDLAFERLYSWAKNSNHGLYIRAYVNEMDLPREVPFGKAASKLIPRGKTLLLCHQVEFVLQLDGRRLWKYWSKCEGFYVENDYIEIMVAKVTEDDVVLSFDVDLRYPRPFQRIIKLASARSPIFCSTTPFGSFTGLHSILSDVDLLQDGLTFLQTSTFADFAGADNESVIINWLVPKTLNRNLGIFYLGSINLAAAVSELVADSEFPNVVFGKGTDLTPKTTFGKPQDRWTCYAERLWQTDDSNAEMLAPKNAAIPVTHLMAFGF